LNEAQSELRSRLCHVAPPPDSAAREPLGQLLAHLQLAVGPDEADVFSALQIRLQRVWSGLQMSKSSNK
jgi:hypothetical protein